MAEQTENAGAKSPRPVLLTVLCILSFIGSGLSVITFLALIIGAGRLMELLSFMPGMAEGGAGAIGYLAIALILNIGTLTGAILMWGLKKIGYFIYVAAYVLQFILPIVFGVSTFSILGLVIMAVFVILYGINLKYMK